MASGREKLLLVGPLPPPYAGPEIVTSTLLGAERLQEVFDVVHVDTTFRRSNAEKGKVDPRMVWAYLTYVGRLLKVLLGHRPKYLLYLPTSATLVGWVRDGTSLALGLGLGCKCAVLFQGGHFGSFYWRSPRAVRLVVGRLLRWCKRVFTQSEGLQRQFEGIVPREILDVLPNCIGEKFFERFRDDAVRGNGLRVLFVGHLSFAKGYCEVLKVVGPLSSRHDVRFLFMGAKKKAQERNIFVNQLTGQALAYEDPDDVYRKAIQERELEGRVAFLGETVAGEDKVRAFQEADVFVLPSYSEGFSTAMLEAMAASLPVVVSRVGVAPEVIEEGVNGYVVSPGDVAELERRLDQLLGDRALRERMGRENRELVRRNFLAGHVAGRLAQTLVSM